MSLYLPSHSSTRSLFQGDRLAAQILTQTQAQMPRPPPSTHSLAMTRVLGCHSDLNSSLISVLNWLCDPKPIWSPLSLRSGDNHGASHTELPRGLNEARPHSFSLKLPSLHLPASPSSTTLVTPHGGQLHFRTRVAGASPGLALPSSQWPVHKWCLVILPCSPLPSASSLDSIIPTSLQTHCYFFHLGFK